MSSFVMGQAYWKSEDKLKGWDLTSGWTASAATINNATQFTVTINTGFIRRNTVIEIGKTYIMRVVGTTNLTSSLIFCDYNQVNVYKTIATGSFDQTFTFTSKTTGIMFYGIGTGSVTISSMVLQEVLLSSPIGKAKTNFVTVAPSSINEPNCVFSYSGNKPINKTIVDESGNGNNGTLNGGTMYATGTESGLQFDGVNDYVSVADANSLDFGTTSFAVELYVKYKTKASTQQFILKYESGSSYRFSVGANSSNYLFAAIADNASGYVSTLTNDILLTDGQTYHIIVVYDRTNKFIYRYVNGIKSGTDKDITSVNGSTSSSGALLLGASYSSEYSPSIIYSAKLYNAALTAQQVREKWNKIANKPYIIEDFSDGTVGKFPRDWTRVSGTHVIASGTPKYLNCTSTGNLYFTTRDNASNCYMTYDYYTSGAWTSKAGLVSTLSTAEATLDYNSTNRKLTFIMGTNDRVRNIKIIRGALVQ